MENEKKTKEANKGKLYRQRKALDAAKNKMKEWLCVNGYCRCSAM